MVNPGKFRNCIRVMRRPTTVDCLGQPTGKGWESVCSVFKGCFEPQGLGAMSEREQADRFQDSLTGTLTVYTKSLPCALESCHRIEIDCELFCVLGVDSFSDKKGMFTFLKVKHDRE